MTTLHTAAVVVTMDSRGAVFRDGGVAVADGRILAVGSAHELAAAYPAAGRIRHEPHWLMPGLHNAHGHLAGWPPDAPLELFLLSRYAPEDSDAVYQRALATGTALVRSGVVSTHHLHYGGYERQAVRGYSDAGVRLEFCLGALDRYAVLPYDEDDRDLRARLPPALARDLERQPPAKPVASVERYLERWDALASAFGSDPGVELVLGPDNPQWCSDECLLRLRELGLPMHMHCQETAAQRAFSVAKTGISPVERLARLGVLSTDVTLAHLTHASDEDIELVSRAGVRVAWNPASNLRLGSGVTRVRELVEAGVELALGVDGGGFADDCDLLAEVRLGSLLQRVLDSRSPGLSDAEMLATVARPLVPGARADLVAIEPLPGSDPVRSIVRGASARHVRRVFVDGREVLAREGAPEVVPMELLPAVDQAPLATALAPYIAQALAGASRSDALARRAASDPLP